MPPIQTVIVDFLDSAGNFDAMRRLKRSCTFAFVLPGYLTSPLPDSKYKKKDQDKERRCGSNTRTYNSSSTDMIGLAWLNGSICGRSSGVC